MQQKAQGSLRPEDPEQYQQKALSQWLPIAVADRNSDAYRALEGLAEVFAEHQDFWWRDFLRDTKPSDMDAVRALNTAALNNEQGLYSKALEQAVRAAATFTSEQNQAGRFMALLQEVYASRSMLEGETCLARADHLSSELSLTKYEWLQGQLALEKAQCRNFHGDLAESDSDSQISLQIAQRFQFPVLEMRILGISASMHSQQGRCSGAWEQGTQGLAHYWQGGYPPERLDQFYAVLWQCTQQAGNLYIAEAILKHTLEIRENPQYRIPRNPIREGLLHLRLSNMLFAQKRFEASQLERKKALALLENVPEAYAKEYKMIINIEPAELELHQGDPALALATLNQVSEHLPSIQDKLITATFYRLLGDTQWELQKLDDAAKAYQKAIDIAEGPLKGLKDGPDRVAWLRATDDSYRGLIRILIAENKIEDALRRWEWYKSRPLLQGLNFENAHLSRNDTNVKVKAEEKAPDTENRVVYANFKDGLEIWTSNKQGIFGTWVSVPQQEFEQTVRSFTERCATPDSDLNELKKLGAGLYAQLLEPVISKLNANNEITVELDRSASNLALEALTTPSGSYFGQHYSLIYSPGAWLEKKLHAPKPVTTSTSLFLLDASHAPGAGYLPGIDAQKNVISTLFHRTRLVDSTQTEWTGIQSHIGTSEVFHYVGHGRLDAAGTTLDYDSRRSLRGRDFVPGLFTQSQLVVLAACSTGKDLGLLDTNGLVRNFLVAGVPAVIASHWNVDSQTTSTLMIEFYQNLARGKTIGNSMSEARAEVLKAKPHPYYWAGFSLYGRAS